MKTMSTGAIILALMASGASAGTNSPLSTAEAGVVREVNLTQLAEAVRVEYRNHLGENCNSSSAHAG